MPLLPPFQQHARCTYLPVHSPTQLDLSHLHCLHALTPRLGSVCNWEYCCVSTRMPFPYDAGQAAHATGRAGSRELTREWVGKTAQVGGKGDIYAESWWPWALPEVLQLGSCPTSVYVDASPGDRASEICISPCSSRTRIKYTKQHKLQAKLCNMRDTANLLNLHNACRPQNPALLGTKF